MRWFLERTKVFSTLRNPVFKYIPVSAAKSWRIWNQSRNGHIAFRENLCRLTGVINLILIVVYSMYPAPARAIGFALTAVSLSLLTEIACHVGTIFLVSAPCSQGLDNFPLVNFWMLVSLSAYVDKHPFCKYFADGCLVLLMICSFVLGLYKGIYAEPLFSTWLAQTEFLLICMAWTILGLTVLIDGIRIPHAAQPWWFLIGTFLWASPLTSCSIYLGGVYFWSGISKLFNYSFYSDTAPEFFAPIFCFIHWFVERCGRLLSQTTRNRLATYFCYVFSGAGVFAEAFVGYVLMAGAMSTSFSPLVGLFAQSANILMHGYIVGIVRLESLVNWNTLCLLLCQLSFMSSSDSLHITSWHTYNWFMFLVFGLVPSLAYTVFYPGPSFAHTYYAPGFGGSTFLLVRRDDVEQKANRVSRHNFGPSKVDTVSVFTRDKTTYNEFCFGPACTFPFEYYLSTLERDGHIKEVAAALGLEPTFEALLAGTAAVDSQLSYLGHALTRPIACDVYLEWFICVDNWRWFWRFFNQRYLGGRRAVFVDADHWDVCRGVRTSVYRIENECISTCS